jgi:hypothetical protein
MIKPCPLFLGLLVMLSGQGAFAAGGAVNITHSLPKVEVLHQGKKVAIERNPDTENMLDPDYSLTSRPCPPFCVQPMSLGPGVEKIGRAHV